MSTIGPSATPVPQHSAAGRPSKAPASVRNRRPLLLRLLENWAVALPIGILVLVFLVGPALTIVVDSFRGPNGLPTLDNWSRIFSSPPNVQAITGSITLGAVVATLSVIIGTPLAWVISHLRIGRRSVAVALLNVAGNLSATTLVFGASAAFGTVGLITLTLQSVWPDFAGVDLYDRSGMMLVFLYFHIPLYVMVILPSMGLPSVLLWEAAAISGASPWFFWRRVGLPMLFPFLLAGWVLIFIWAISQYGIPLALGAASGGVDLMAMRIGSLISTAGRGNRLEQAACLSLLLIVISGLALFFYQRLLRWAAGWTK